MRIFATVLVFILMSCGLVGAEERVALVIGNGGYRDVAPLDNAIQDAALIARTLEQLEFDVTLVENTTQAELKQAVADFGRRLRAEGPDTVGLFYYAGHGVQSFGANYLLPVDAALSVAADLDLVGVDASTVLRQMASARNRTNIVILDACRNNPFDQVPDLNDNGLAEMKAPTGTFLAYATAPGAVALDGAGRHSPFTDALSRAVLNEGTPIEQVFKQVRIEVIKETGGAQTPWDTSSLTRDFVFKPGEVLSPREIAEQQLWESVSQSRDAIQIMLFLRQYPDGRKHPEARALLNRVLTEELDTTRQADAGATAAPQVPRGAEVSPAPPADQPAPDRPAPPAQDEAAMLGTARASGTLEDYQAYLDAYPDGTFAELVRIEIDSIRQKATTDPDRPSPAAVTPIPAPPGDGADDADFEVFFDKPLDRGVPQIVGRTIMEVTQTSPLFPPLQGLPDALWKDQTCTGCHQWTRDDLCTQAKVYLKESMARSVEKQHPLGGSFKRALKVWAQGGCR